MEAAVQGRDEALAIAPELRAQGSSPLVGATIHFTNIQLDADIHLGHRMAKQFESAAKFSPDFFVVEGCAGPRDVAEVVAVLHDNRHRRERVMMTDLRGFENPSEEPREVGFDVPTIIMLDPETIDGSRAFGLGMAHEVAKAPERLCGIAAPKDLLAVWGDDSGVALASTRPVTESQLACMVVL